MNANKIFGSTTFRPISERGISKIISLPEFSRERLSSFLMDGDISTLTINPPPPPVPRLLIETMTQAAAYLALHNSL